VAVERATVEVYEREAVAWDARRPPRHRPRAAALAARALPDKPRADLGCGPGGYLADLGQPVLGIDAAGAMLILARAKAPASLLVQGDLEALPFRDSSLGAAWARNTYLHVPRVRLPLALARLHWALAPEAPVELSVALGDDDGPWPEDDFPGRLFSRWRPEPLGELLVGAGFVVEDVAIENDVVWARARRARTLPDTVAPGMRVLVCGLNPSLVAADAGFGYAGATNRFWPAALAAGLVSRPRDPLHALSAHGVGMTDLVKRATPGAGEMTPAEYRAGAERVRRLIEWLQPASVLFVGLAGCRAAVDHSARPGLQPAPFGGVPAYVMPSTSGRNARARSAELIAHMRGVLAIADEAA
jgi:TDG/mug DNA glycosylase family protein